MASNTAVLRCRLHDIDRVFSRTASHTLLTGLLALVYIALVTLADRSQTRLRGEPDLDVPRGDLLASSG